MTYCEGQKLHDEKRERCEHHGASGDGGKMSNENQEAIADTVADIRAQNQGLPEDDYALSPLVCDLLSISNRIEAAAKREVAELRECLKETMADAVAEYKNNSCFKNVKCGEIERCGTCKVMKWRNALEGASND